MNPPDLGCLQDAGAAQIAFAFVAHSGRKVAGTRLTVLHFSGGRQSKAFFCAFMGLLLGHIGSLVYLIQTPAPASIDPLLYPEAVVVKGGV